MKTLLFAGLLIPIWLIPHAQDPSPKENPNRGRPIPRVDYTIVHDSLPRPLPCLNAESNMPDLSGEATTAPKQRRYFYLPTLLLQEDAAGRLLADASPDGAVRVVVELDRPGLRRIVVDHLIENHLLQEDPTPGQVLPVPLRRLALRTRGFEPTIEFDPFEDLAAASYSITLTARTNPDAARRLVTGLAAGSVSLQGELLFEGFEFSRDQVTIRMSDILETKTYKDLSGNAGPDQVGRRQVASMVAEAASTLDITVSTESSNPDFQLTVEQLLTLMFSKSEQTQFRTNHEIEDMAQAFLDLGWNAEDFRADLLTHNSLTSNHENATHFEQDLGDISKNAGAGQGGLNVFGVFSLGGGGSSESYKEHRAKVLSTTLDKWGFSHEKAGDMTVPKGLNLYRLDRSRVRSDELLRYGNLRRVRSEGRMVMDIDSRVHRGVGNQCAIADWIARYRDALVPVGAMVSFFGPKDDAESLAKVGYVICDGRPIGETTATWLQGRSTPNMEGLLPLGGAVTPDSLGQKTGSEELEIPKLSVDTIVNWFTGGNEPNAIPPLGPHVGAAWGNYHRLTTSGTTGSTRIPNRPASMPLVWLLRVR